jgi:hypothetical protein
VSESTKAISEAVLESRARCAAPKVGLLAIKSRWRRNTMDNYGGFQIVDPYFNRVETGSRFDMSAEEVIEYCKENQGAFPPNE